MAAYSRGRTQSIDKQSRRMELLLWGQDSKASATLDYIRKHAVAEVQRLAECNPRTKYVLARDAHDVCLFREIIPMDVSGHPGEMPVVTAVPLSIETIMSNFTSSDHPTVVTNTETLGRVHVRASTVAPGCIKTVMELLAPHRDRNMYWVGMNTEKALRSAAIFESHQLSGAEPFPRWSQKYLATRLTSLATRSVDTCYAEYVRFESDSSAMRRKGIVYRRTIDDRMFNLDHILGTTIALHGEESGCDRMWIENWIYEIQETMEPNRCEITLTCTVHFTGESITGNVRDFPRYCVQSLSMLRKFLLKQWKENGHIVGGQTATLWKRGGITKSCGVCSTAFSMLKKKYICHLCEVCICAKCSTKISTAASQLGQQAANIQVYGNGRTATACTLCFLYGTNDQATSSSFTQTFMSSSSINSNEDLEQRSNQSDHTNEDDSFRKTLQFPSENQLHKPSKSARHYTTRDEGTQSARMASSQIGRSQHLSSSTARFTIDRSRSNPNSHTRKQQPVVPVSGPSATYTAFSPASSSSSSSSRGKSRRAFTPTQPTTTKERSESSHSIIPDSGLMLLSMEDMQALKTESSTQRKQSEDIKASGNGGNHVLTRKKSNKLITVPTSSIEELTLRTNSMEKTKSPLHKTVELSDTRSNSIPKETVLRNGKSTLNEPDKEPEAQRRQVEDEELISI